jgi:hypothetical protein
MPPLNRLQPQHLAKMTVIQRNAVCVDGNRRQRCSPAKPGSSFTLSTGPVIEIERRPSPSPANPLADPTRHWHRALSNAIATTPVPIRGAAFVGASHLLSSNIVP